MSQKQYKPHYVQLKKKWLERQKDVQKSLWEQHKESLEWLQKSTKHVIVGSLASVFLMTHPVAASAITPVAIPSPDKQFEDKIHNRVDKKSALMQAMTTYLPKEVQPLTEDQEQMLGKKFTDIIGIRVSAELQGKRLNRSYGYIGQEQHLTRFPGDTMATHFNETPDPVVASKGMAPGRGAWGYFAQGSSLTQKDIDREKYYIAVPTFLAPGYNDNVNEYYKFFKFHKMLLVNPDNGKAMVAVIGDSGPAPFTGKHLGGSPEVMQYLERVDGAQKGPVVYFFIDDPNDTIPLGPIDL